MQDLIPVHYRRMSHHEAAFRDSHDRALSERMRHPFRAFRKKAKKAG